MDALETSAAAARLLPHDSSPFDSYPLISVWQRFYSRFFLSPPESLRHEDHPKTDSS